MFLEEGGTITVLALEVNLHLKHNKSIAPTAVQRHKILDKIHNDTKSLRVGERLFWRAIFFRPWI